MPTILKKNQLTKSKVNYNHSGSICTMTIPWHSVLCLNHINVCVHVNLLRQEGLIWLENNIVTFFNYSRHSALMILSHNFTMSQFQSWSSRMPSHILFNKAGQEHPEQLSHINITQGVHRSFVYNVGWLNNGECYPSKEQYYYSRIFSCVKWGSCVNSPFSSSSRWAFACSHFFPYTFNILNHKKMKTSFILPSIFLKLDPVKRRALCRSITITHTFLTFAISVTTKWKSCPDIPRYCLAWQM